MRGARQPVEDPPAEVAHREQPDGGDDHAHDPTMKMIWMARRHAAAEAPQTGGEAQDRDRRRCPGCAR
jgi:hypothetical protein